jgi:Amt family ammonium transporter
VVSVAFSFGVSFVIAKVVDMKMGLRVSPETELERLDLPVHAETACSQAS